MKITRSDVITICLYIIAGGGLITAKVLSALNISDANQQTILTVVSIVVGVATLIRNRLLNPTPPAGMVSANIPVGTIPQVQPQKGPPTP